MPFVGGPITLTANPGWRTAAIFNSKNPRYLGKNRKPRYFGNTMTDRHKIWHDVFAKFGTLKDPVFLRTTALSNWNWKLIRDVSGAAVSKIEMTS